MRFEKILSSKKLKEIARMYKRNSTWISKKFYRYFSWRAYSRISNEEKKKRLKKRFHLTLLYYRVNYKKFKENLRRNVIKIYEKTNKISKNLREIF